MISKLSNLQMFNSHVLFMFVFLCIINCGQISTNDLSIMKESRFDNHTISTNSPSLIDLFNLKENKFRKGFEPFYFISNVVIDIVQPINFEGKFT